MQVTLTVVGGKADRRQVRVKVPVVIGRSREAGLVVAHPMVSRRHCELYVAEGLLRVRDLGSLNGVYVGGRRVVEAALPPRAEFSIGPLTLRVDYVPEAPAAQAALPAAATNPPPAGDVTTDWGDFDIHIPELEGEAPADQAAAFPIYAEGEAEGPPRERADESQPEKKPSQSAVDRPSLFPEELPPEFGAGG